MSDELPRGLSYGGFAQSDEPLPDKPLYVGYMTKDTIFVSYDDCAYPWQATWKRYPWYRRLWAWLINR